MFFVSMSLSVLPGSGLGSRFFCEDQKFRGEMVCFACTRVCRLLKSGGPVFAEILSLC